MGLVDDVYEMTENLNKGYYMDQRIRDNELNEVQEWIDEGIIVLDEGEGYKFMTFNDTEYKLPQFKVDDIAMSRYAQNYYEDGLFDDDELYDFGIDKNTGDFY